VDEQISAENKPTARCRTDARPTPCRRPAEARLAAHPAALTEV